MEDHDYNGYHKNYKALIGIKPINVIDACTYTALTTSEEASRKANENINSLNNKNINSANKSLSLVCPTLEYPQNSSTLTNNRFELSWSSHSANSGYYLTVENITVLEPTKFYNLNMKFKFAHICEFSKS